MSFIKIIYTCLACLIIILLTKKLSPEHALFSSCIVCLGISVLSVSVLFPVLQYVKELSENETVGDFCEIMFKSSGICLLCGFAAEICNDCGETALSSRIELYGKCTLLAYCLPLIQKVFGYAIEVLD